MRFEKKFQKVIRQSAFAKASADEVVKRETANVKQNTAASSKPKAKSQYSFAHGNPKPETKN